MSYGEGDVYSARLQAQALAVHECHICQALNVDASAFHIPMPNGVSKRIRYKQRNVAATRRKLKAATGRSFLPTPRRGRLCDCGAILQEGRCISCEVIEGRLRA